MELDSGDYRIDEDDGPLEVCARIVPPTTLERPAEVTLSTRGGTAIGLSYIDKHNLKNCCVA